MASKTQTQEMLARAAANAGIMLEEQSNEEEMTTFMLPTDIVEEQDTHRCGKCNIYFLTLKEYIEHKLSRDNCSVRYSKRKGSKVLMPTITENTEPVKVPKPPPKGKKRGPKGPHKKLEPSAIIENIPEYRCKHCDKTFKRKATLQRHIQFDHETKDDVLKIEDDEDVDDDDGIDRDLEEDDKDYKPEIKRDRERDPATGSPHKRGRLEQEMEIVEEVDVSEDMQFDMMTLNGGQILVRPATKSLVQPSNDPAHFKVSSTRPFQCEECKRAFKDANVLKAHMLTHSNDREYPCTWERCTYAFKTKGSLKRHMRRHTGERPFRCELCGRSFGESGALTRHLRSRTPCVNKSDLDLPRYGQSSTFLRDIPAARGQTGELPNQELLNTSSSIDPETQGQQTIVITQAPGMSLSPEDLQVIGDAAAGDRRLGDRLQVTEQKIIMDENGEEKIMLVLRPDGPVSNGNTDITIEHQQQQPEQHECQVCRDGFESKEDLLEHLKGHMTVSQQHRCHFCNYETASENTLNLHLRITHRLTKVMDPSQHDPSSVIQMISGDQGQGQGQVVMQGGQMVLQGGQIISSDQLTSGEEIVASFDESGQQIITSLDESGQQIVTNLGSRVLNLEDIGGGQQLAIEEVDSMEEEDIEATIEMIEEVEGDDDVQIQQLTDHDGNFQVSQTVFINGNEIIVQEGDSEEDQNQEEHEQEGLQDSVQNSLQDNVQNSLQDNVQNSLQDNVQNSLQDNVQNSLQYNVQNSSQDGEETAVQYFEQNALQDNVQNSLPDNIQYTLQDGVQYSLVPNSVQDHVQYSLQDGVQNSLQENIQNSLQDFGQDVLQDNVEVHTEEAMEEDEPTHLDQNFKTSQDAKLEIQPDAEEYAQGETVLMFTNQEETLDHIVEHQIAEEKEEKYTEEAEISDEQNHILTEDSITNNQTSDYNKSATEPSSRVEFDSAVQGIANSSDSANFADSANYSAHSANSAHDHTRQEDDDENDDNVMYMEENNSAEEGESSSMVVVSTMEDINNAERRLAVSTASTSSGMVVVSSMEDVNKAEQRLIISAAASSSSSSSSSSGMRRQPPKLSIRAAENDGEVLVTKFVGVGGPEEVVVMPEEEDQEEDLSQEGNLSLVEENHENIVYNESDVEGEESNQVGGGEDGEEEQEQEEMGQLLRAVKHEEVEEATTEETSELKDILAASVALQQTMDLQTGPKSSKVGNKTIHHCPVCRRTFVSSHYLKLHLRSHIGERPHTCQVCQKTFMTRDSLVKHMVVHSNERNYKCGDCGKLFKRISHVREHLKVHMIDRPYNCIICTKTFKSTNACKVHMRTHTDHLPHECHFCHRTFREKGSLQRHVRTHTGEKPYSCQYCKRSFSEHGTLNRHLKAKVPCRGRAHSKPSTSISAGGSSESPSTSSHQQQHGGTGGGGENTVLAEFSTVVADTQQYIISEPGNIQQDSAGVDIDSNSQMLVLSGVEEGEDPTVMQQQENSEDIQPGEYTIMEQTDEIITLMDKNTGQILQMPADAVVMNE